MAALLADGWFYISAGGFLVSSILFVFLLGQYRAAVEAEDREEEFGGFSYMPRPVTVAETRQDLPVAVVTPISSAPKGFADYSEPESSPKDEPSAVKAPETVAQPEPAPTPVLASSPEAEKAATSPAVSFLHDLKTQIDGLDHEITDLKSLTARQAEQGDVILKRLAELADKLKKEPPARTRKRAQPNLTEATIERIAPPPSSQSQAPQPKALDELPETPPQDRPSAAEQPAPKAAEPVVVPAAQPAPQSMTTKTIPEGNQDGGAQAPPELKPNRKGPVWHI